MSWSTRSRYEKQFEREDDAEVQNSRLAMWCFVWVRDRDWRLSDGDGDGDGDRCWPVTLATWMRLTRVLKRSLLRS